MLSMPVMRAERSRSREKVAEDRVTIGLSLDASSLIEHLLRYRGGAGLRATATGYDVFAAMLLSEASGGMSRVQAMRLVVDMIEPIKRSLDVGAGGVTFVFGDATSRESQQQEAV
jgi:hypothetical protein